MRRFVRGAIVLAGGSSRRLGRPKPFVEVGGVPLIQRVAATAGQVVDEVVVVSRGDLAARIERSLRPVRVVRDRSRVRSPLVGLVAGSEASRSEYVAALACDLPFLRPALLRLLFSAANGRGAAIPRWPTGMIEPLVAVYARRPLLHAARAALEAGERSNHSMIHRIEDVRYVDVARLRSADAQLDSFMNVNSPSELVRARHMARRFARGPRTR